LQASPSSPLEPCGLPEVWHFGHGAMPAQSLLSGAKRTSDFRTGSGCHAFCMPKNIDAHAAWLDNDDDAPEDEYKGILCPACTGVHFMNPKRGRLSGQGESEAPVRKFQLGGLRAFFGDIAQASHSLHTKALKLLLVDRTRPQLTGGRTCCIHLKSTLPYGA